MPLLPEATGTFLTCCLLSMYVVYHHLFVHNQPMSVPVDIVLSDEGRTEMVISGIDHRHVETDRRYELQLHVVFVDSWITATSGLVSFRTEEGLGTSIRPYPYSPSIWMVWRMVFFPAHVTGIIPDTLIHDVELVVHGDSIGSVIRVYITPTRHMADILSVSGYYRVEDQTRLINKWSILYGILFYLSLTAILRTIRHTV